MYYIKLDHCSTLPKFFQPRAYLNAVVTVREVVHGLELLVNDANASFVGAVGDFLDVLGALAQGSELLVDDLGSFDRCLRVEFGYDKIG